ncbi:V-type ATP synthase subunit I [archaeon]|nr:MAG: V-type ATP synthase subunit I [archaeon]
MLKPKKMNKVLIVGSKDVLESTINTLYDLKIIHIIDYQGSEEGFEIGKPIKKTSLFSEYVLSLRALKDVLNLSDKSADREMKDFEFSKEFKERLDHLENEVMKKRKKLEDIQILLSDIEKIDDVGELKKLGLSEDVNSIMLDLINSKENLIKEKQELEDELKHINEEYRNFIVTAEDFLSREIEKAETPLRLATTENTFVIEGWMPSDNIEHAREELQKSTGDKVHVVELDEVEEGIPTYVETPKPFKPFDTLVDMFSTPNYDEVSPTLLIAFTFPLFYGFMLGDFGYGLSLFGLVQLLRRKMHSTGWQSLLNMMSYASYFTMFFGLFYGEFFGAEIYHTLGIDSVAGIHLPIAHRLDEIVPLLIASVGIGVVHITLGYVIGFINVYRKEGLKHAILEKISWIGILYCIIGFLLFPDYTYPIGGVLVVFAVMMILGEGMIGLLEIFTLISHLVSYTRLLAIGLSSVGIALAINKIAFDLLLPNGIFYAILGVLLLVMGHTLNLALGIIASFLHSLRLQYVEFFTKFYKGGGVKFTPLGIRNEEV